MFLPSSLMSMPKKGKCDIYRETNGAYSPNKAAFHTSFTEYWVPWALNPVAGRRISLTARSAPNCF